MVERNIKKNNPGQENRLMKGSTGLWLREGLSEESPFKQRHIKYGNGLW